MGLSSHHDDFKLMEPPAKRRRLDKRQSSSDLEEIVDTSDIDEREALYATESQYWRADASPVIGIHKSASVECESPSYPVKTRASSLPVRLSSIPFSPQPIPSQAISDYHSSVEDPPNLHCPTSPSSSRETPRLSRFSVVIASSAPQTPNSSPDILDLFLQPATPPHHRVIHSFNRVQDDAVGFSPQEGSPPTNPTTNLVPGVDMSLQQDLRDITGASVILPKDLLPSQVTPHIVRTRSAQVTPPLLFPQSNHASPTSSPLSSPRSTFSPDRPVLRGASLGITTPSKPPSENATRALSNPPTPFHGRHLRARRPIQLNPYLGDRLQYEATLKERGLELAIFRAPQERGLLRSRRQDDDLDPDFVIPDNGPFAAKPSRQRPPSPGPLPGPSSPSHMVDLPEVMQGFGGMISDDDEDPFAAASSVPLAKSGVKRRRKRPPFVRPTKLPRSSDIVMEMSSPRLSPTPPNPQDDSSQNHSRTRSLSPPLVIESPPNSPIPSNTSQVQPSTPQVVEDDQPTSPSRDMLPDEVIHVSPEHDARADSDAESAKSPVPGDDLVARTEAKKLSKEDRRKWKAMNSMMPRVMVNQLLTKETRKKKAPLVKKPRAISVSSDEGEVRAGQSKVRIAAHPRATLELQGDAESSTSQRSSSDDDTSVIGTGELRSEVGLEDTEIQAWFESQHTAPQRDPDRPRGGDLIDRMLSRTSRLGKASARRKRSGVAGAGISSIGSGPRKPMEVTTKEARRLGAGSGKQLTLFETLPRDQWQSTTVNDAQSNQVANPHGKRREKRKRKSGTKPSSRRKQAMRIDEDDDNFIEALAPAHQAGPKTVYRKPKVPEKPAGSKTIPRGQTTHQDLDEADGFSGGRSADVINAIRNQRDVIVDFDIPFLPSGIQFAPDTGIRKGKLFELVTLASKPDSATPPNCFSGFGLDLRPTMTYADFEVCLPSIFDAIFEQGTLHTLDPSHEGKGLKDFTCQYLSYIVQKETAEDSAHLVAAIRDQLHHFVARLTDWVSLEWAVNREPHDAAIDLHWFAVELSFRASCAVTLPLTLNDISHAGSDSTDHYITVLITRLHEYGLERTTRVLTEFSNKDFEDNIITSRTIELWVYILHVVIATTHPSDPILASDRFWALVDTSRVQQRDQPHSELDACERIWRIAFSLSAISQFSVHGMTTSIPRLGASWKLVSKALACIRLSADPKIDQPKSAKTLQLRDRYVRLVTSRCLLLCTKWHWRIHDDGNVFRQLCEIFKSRSYANLIGETSDFPPFIRYHDHHLLQESSRRDSAYGIFIKLIVRASNELDALADDGGRTKAKQLTKLLSMAVPVGSTGFTKTSPPLGAELSKLYNRFSAVLLALYLEPTLSNARVRIQQARRFVDFRDADWNSRVASLRAMMHMAVLHRHFKIPVDSVMAWADDMCDLLVSDYKQFNELRDPPLYKGRIVMLVQLLIGSMRRILETENMDPSLDTEPMYPDPLLLRGSLIHRLFKTPGLIDLVGNEILDYVHCFLELRKDIAPPPQQPLAIPIVTEETQDSQDEYGQFHLDLNDPELLAALEGLDSSPKPLDQFRVLDEITAEIITTYIAPAMYYFVCKHVGPDHREAGQITEAEEFSYDAWVDCWVACANIAVQNGKKDWSMYMQMGLQSWGRIGETTRRRRVGLRFLHMILKLDPSAYTKFTDEFVDMWFQAIVTARVSIEHEYCASFFRVDGLRHPWFCDIPSTQDSEGNFVFTPASFREQRLPILRVVLKNMAMRRNGPADVTRQRENAQGITCLINMLSTMEGQLQTIGAEDIRRPLYLDFCREVLSVIHVYPALRDPRLSDALKWTVDLR